MRRLTRRLIQRSSAFTEERDRGSFTVWTVLFAMVLMMAIGLVFDGGGKLRALRDANLVAAEAARAGGQAVDPAAAARGDLFLGPAAAKRAATTYLQAAGVQQFTVTVVNGEVQVTVQDTYQPVFLQAIGVESLPVTGSAKVNIVRQIDAGQTDT